MEMECIPLRIKGCHKYDLGQPGAHAQISPLNQYELAPLIMMLREYNVFKSQTNSPYSCLPTVGGPMHQEN